MLEVHRQSVAGTNFRLKLRLRNGIAPDCSNDEVFLRCHQNCDEEDFMKKENNMMLMLTFQTMLMVIMQYFLHDHDKLKSQSSPQLSSRLSYDHHPDYHQVRVCEVVIHRPLPCYCDQRDGCLQILNPTSINCE